MDDLSRHGRKNEYMKRERGGLGRTSDLVEVIGGEKVYFNNGPNLITRKFTKQVHVKHELQQNKFSAELTRKTLLGDRLSGKKT